MRLLVVGAGISGLTVAALLRRGGHDVVLIDRRSGDADAGYALALWPHGTRVFHALGIHDEFIARAEPMGAYVMSDGDGVPLVESAMPAAVTDRGFVGVIDRGEMTSLLEQAAGEIRRGVTVEGFSETAADVQVRLDDGTSDTFDAVIGADGMHSRVRELLLGRIDEFDTGWGCHVWWADRNIAGTETTERMGAGTFLGTYPCRDRVCVILGGAASDLLPDQPTGRSDRIAGRLQPFGVPVEEFCADLPADDQDLFWWRMADVRSPRWTRGRIGLVGDAATGFLPTAGIGASMALESAAALADELSRTDAAHVQHALALYEKRRRQRVESVQTQSRWLARMMFLEQPALVRARNVVARRMSIGQALGGLIKLLDEPI